MELASDFSLIDPHEKDPPNQLRILLNDHSQFVNEIVLGAYLTLLREKNH